MKAVCMSCNQTWLVIGQDAAMPILIPRINDRTFIQLNSRMQTILAMAAKTVMTPDTSIRRGGRPPIRTNMAHGQFNAAEGWHVLASLRLHNRSRTRPISEHSSQTRNPTVDNDTPAEHNINYEDRPSPAMFQSSTVRGKEFGIFSFPGTGGALTVFGLSRPNHFLAEKKHSHDVYARNRRFLHSQLRVCGQCLVADKCCKCRTTRRAPCHGVGPPPSHSILRVG